MTNGRMKYITWYHHALVRFPFFIVFIRVAYDQSQTLASVGLSIFYHFCLHHMVNHMVKQGSLRLVPIKTFTTMCG